MRKGKQNRRPSRQTRQPDVKEELPMRLAHRTIQNALYNVGSWVFPIAVSFVFTPYIVKMLGASAYGVLTLVWSVIGYFTFLDLGLGQAVTKFVAEATGRGDVREANHAIGAAVLVSAVLGTLGGAVIFLLAGVLARRWLEVPAAMTAAAVLAFQIGAVGFVVGMFHAMCRAVLRGLNRYDVTSVITVLSSVLATTGTAALLFLRCSLPHIVLLNVGVQLLATVIYSIAASRASPGLCISPVTDRKAMGRMLRFGLFATLGRAAYTALCHFDRIVIAAILGVSAVTFCVVPTTFVERISALAMQISNVIFPAVSELQGQRREADVAELYLTANRVMTALSTALCVPLLVFGQRLLTLWMGEEFATQTGMVVVLATVGAMVNNLTNIPSFTADGMGKPQVTGLSAVSVAILYFSFMIPLARIMGINGVALAGVLCNVIVAPIFMWYVTRRVLGLTGRRLFLEALAGPYGLGLVLFLLLRLIPQESITNIFVLLVVMGVSAVVYLGAAVFTGVFASRERGAMLGYLRLVQARLQGT